MEADCNDLSLLPLIKSVPVNYQGATSLDYLQIRDFIRTFLQKKCISSVLTRYNLSVPLIPLP